MSHVAKILIKIKDLAALKKAALELGLEFVENQKSYRWFGQHVGDYKLPEGFSAKDLGKCDHAIRIPGNKNAYEIGVCKAKDGSGNWELLWDFWAGGYGLEKIVGKNGQKLVQGYTATLAKEHYKKIGWRVTSTMKDGKMVLKAYK